MKQQKKPKNTQYQMQKQTRLMEALRANLRKRKIQVKGRHEQDLPVVIPETPVTEPQSSF